MEEEKQLPEAPQSVTIKGYYKGFSVLLTKRDPEVKTMPLLESSMKAIDWMITNGFKPSWSDDTNKSIVAQKVNAPREYNHEPVNQEACGHGNTIVRESKSEKNYGKSYKACVDCKKFLAWA